MSRRESLFSTTRSVLILGAGILIGVLIGNQSYREFSDSGRTRNAGESTSPFVSGARDGDTATLEMLPELIVAQSAPESDSIAESAGSDEIQYFPEAIASSDALRSSIPRNDATDAEDSIWKEQLADLSDEEAEEVLELRRRLGSVASETLGVLNGQAALAEPGLFPVPPDDIAKRVDPIGSPRTPEILLASADVNPHREQFRDDIRRVNRINARNVETIGFKQLEVVLLNGGDFNTAEQNVAESADESISDSSGNVAWIVRVDSRAGALVTTENESDLAIEGPGWFAVLNGNERRFTRSGLTAIDEKNRLALRTSVGLLPFDPPIRIPEGSLESLSVSVSGECSALITGEDEPIKCGRITPVRFRDVSALERLDNGLYAPSRQSGSGSVCNASKVTQGKLERSNVAIMSNATESRMRSLSDLLDN